MNVQTDVATLSQYDHCVIATGVKGYTPSIVGVNHPCVVGYQAVLDGTASIDGRVAIIGAGGIGFDVASYITGAKLQKNTQPADLVFSKQWGIDLTVTSPGGVISKQMKKSAVDELPQVYLLQRKLRKHGADLGKTTGWIHREHLKHQGVKMLAALSYEKIDEQGLHISVRNRERLLAVDHIIICSGQESVLPPYHKLLDELTIPVSYIGGALTAEKLDLQRAIGEAFNLAQRL